MRKFASTQSLCIYLFKESDNFFIFFFVIIIIICLASLFVMYEKIFMNVEGFLLLSVGQKVQVIPPDGCSPIGNVSYVASVILPRG